MQCRLSEFFQGGSLLLPTSSVIVYPLVGLVRYDLILELSHKIANQIELRNEHRTNNKPGSHRGSGRSLNPGGQGVQ